MSNPYDLLGKRFHRWTVLERLGRKYSPKRVWWLCRCDCGEERELVTSSLIRGSHSCGCYTKELLIKRQSLEPGLSAKHDVYRGYKQRASKRHLAFELSFDDFLKYTQLDCHYCGSKPSNKAVAKGANGYFIYNGLDRRDNIKGYTHDNVVPCCDICNKAKRHMSYDDFILWIIKLTDNRLTHIARGQRA